MPNKWFDVSTENGQVLVCLFMLMTAYAMHVWGWPAQADTLFTFSLGILGRSLGTGNGNIKGTNLTVRPAIITGNDNMGQPESVTMTKINPPPPPPPALPVKQD